MEESLNNLAKRWIEAYYFEKPELERKILAKVFSLYGINGVVSEEYFQNILKCEFNLEETYKHD